VSLEDELKLLLKDRVTSRKRWARRCPQDLQIAAYVDGTVDSTTRQRLEQHFSDCDRCLDEISFLVRANEWGDAESAPLWLITKVERLIAPAPKKSLRFDWRWATAAVAVTFAIVFAVLFAVRFRTRNLAPERAAMPSSSSGSSVATNSTPSPEQRNPNVIAQSSPTNTPAGQKREPVPVTRKEEGANGLPNLLSPHDGAALKRRTVVFNWQSVPEVAFYDVSIMTASGDLVFSRQSEAESLDLPASLPLQAGVKYFVSVRAHLRDGRTIRSSVVSFRVID
jgi:anti-sigma factor RsiW